MSKMRRFGTVVIALTCASFPVVLAGEQPWLVGYAEADITPGPGKIQMCGFGRERYAEGALAPLLNQVMALRDKNGQTGLLITADLLDFDRIMVEAIRRAITRKHGIPPENIMLSASHTHWGPAVRFQMSYSIGAPNVWYMGMLEDKILANVDAALTGLTPASLEYGSMNFQGIGCIRRFPVGGEIEWRPYPEGSFDGHTPILRVKHGEENGQLLIVGHACHPTSSGATEKWTPDYPGAMRDHLARRLPDTRAMFVQGCGGDAKVVHHDPGTGKLVFSADPKRADAAGEKLAEAVLEHLEKASMISLSGSLACSLATGQLSYGECWSTEEMERVAYATPRNWMTWAARQHLALPHRSPSFRYDVQVWKLGGQLTIFGIGRRSLQPLGANAPRHGPHGAGDGDRLCQQHQFVYSGPKDYSGGRIRGAHVTTCLFPARAVHHRHQHRD